MNIDEGSVHLSFTTTSLDRRNNNLLRSLHLYAAKLTIFGFLTHIFLFLIYV